jgi:hypothetical protein
MMLQSDDDKLYDKLFGLRPWPLLKLTQNLVHKE